MVDPVPPGAVLVGGPYDGAVGPIKAGAFQDDDGSVPAIANRHHLSHSEPSSPQELSTPAASGSDSGPSPAPVITPTTTVINSTNTDTPVTPTDPSKMAANPTDSGVKSSMDQITAADFTDNQGTGTRVINPSVNTTDSTKRRVGVSQLNGLSLSADPTAMQV